MGGVRSRQRRLLFPGYDPSMQSMAFAKCSAPIVRILFSTLLVSCGGGGGSAVAPTPTPPKVNAPQLQFSSASSTAIEGDTIQLVWSSTDATTCEAFGSWSGSLSLAGQSKVKLASYGRPSFGLRCTGAGGTTETSVIVVSRVAVRKLSYSNFKEVGVIPSTVPNGNAARAYGDFFEDGSLSLVTFKFTYKNTLPLADATPGVMEFWTQNASGTWILKPATVTAEVPFCIHARKAIVGDFNEDRKPDIIFSCHGYDAAPFPGEHSIILLSQPGGGFLQRFETSDVAFFHSVTACDLNGDGHLDLVHTVNNGLRVYFGDGHGSFTVAAGHPFSAITGQLFQVECVDVNEDGILDLITGGKEWQSNSSTQIFFGSAGGVYIRQVVPAVVNEGTINDFTLTGTGSARTLWISRSSGGDGTEYVGRMVQRVNLRTLESTSVLNQTPADWIRWLVPYSRAGLDYIGSDNKSDLVEFIRAP